MTVFTYRYVSPLLSNWYPHDGSIARSNVGSGVAAQCLQVTDQLRTAFTGTSLKLLSQCVETVESLQFCDEGNFGPGSICLHTHIRVGTCKVIWALICAHARGHRHACHPKSLALSRSYTLCDITGTVRARRTAARAAGASMAFIAKALELKCCRGICRHIWGHWGFHSCHSHCQDTHRIRSCHRGCSLRFRDRRNGLHAKPCSVEF